MRISDWSSDVCSSDLRRIDTAGKPEQHVAVADLGAYACDCIVDDAVRLPGIAAAADFVDEAGVDARALLRVRDFGVELQTVVTARLIRHAGERQVRRRGDAFETIRQSDDAIAMTHPDIDRKSTRLNSSH